MIIKKIVKFYFIFAIAGVLMATVPHLKSRQDFMANILGIGTYEKSLENVSGTANLYLGTELLSENKKFF
jgi:hypothetical protein